MLLLDSDLVGAIRMHLNKLIGVIDRLSRVLIHDVTAHFLDADQLPRVVPLRDRGYDT